MSSRVSWRNQIYREWGEHRQSYRYSLHLGSKQAVEMQSEDQAPMLRQRCFSWHPSFSAAPFKGMTDGIPPYTWPITGGCDTVHSV